MVYRIADNVLSPLGATTAENYRALKEGRSALKPHTGFTGREGDNYVASQFSEAQRRELAVEGLTWFESLVYHSVKDALAGCHVDVTSPRTLFILSTTKANINHLGTPDYHRLLPAESAARIARLFGITTQPIVVSNACISGVAAIITAQRLLTARSYDTAVVAGCDVISHFVVSGFQSLNAMSPEPCRPFDIERTGLNLGEAAATLVLTAGNPQTDRWQIVNGAIRNDAYHLSSPSPQGEGCARAIRHAVGSTPPDAVAAVNAHGTATMYNDQMESKAIEAAGLSNVPVNALKGYLGHTLGASGIVETILTMHAVEHGRLPATRGYTTTGVSGRINISPQPLAVSQPAFVKIISGFGGNNAAIYCRLCHDTQTPPPLPHYAVEHRVLITPHSAVVDGTPYETQATGNAMLTQLYKRYIGAYPRYYKMDRLSQLGFVAAEMLLSRSQPQQPGSNSRAIMLFNHTASAWADTEYAKTIDTSQGYYPSPALFLYTLPNMVCGEIAIRHAYKAETDFYIVEHKELATMQRLIKAAFLDSSLQSMVAGWVDYQDENNFEADVKLIIKT